MSTDPFRILLYNLPIPAVKIPDPLPEGVLVRVNVCFDGFDPFEAGINYDEYIGMTPAEKDRFHQRRYMDRLKQNPAAYEARLAMRREAERLKRAADRKAKS